jgi:hypothetical protein
VEKAIAVADAVGNQAKDASVQMFEQGMKRLDEGKNHREDEPSVWAALKGVWSRVCRSMGCGLDGRLSTWRNGTKV